MKRHTFLRTIMAAGIGLALSACSTTTHTDQNNSAAGKTVFLAGATGVLGQPLTRLLIERGYTVYGTTRSTEKATQLQAIGVKPVVVDVYDAQALTKAVVAARPDVVINQLSDLPAGLKEEEMEAGLERDNRIRIEGTRNLIAASEKAGVRTYIAQSIALSYAPSDQPFTEVSPFIPTDEPTYGAMSTAIQNLEQQVQAAPFTGIVLRYGWLYGPRTGFDAPVNGSPTLHVDAAALAAAEAVEGTQSGVYNVADESPLIDTQRFRQAYPAWRSDFRVER